MTFPVIGCLNWSVQQCKIPCLLAKSGIYCHVIFPIYLKVRKKPMVSWISKPTSSHRWENWYPLVNLHSYGKSPFWMGKSNISMVIFNSKLLNYQRVCPILYGHYFGIFGGHPSSSFPCWSHHHFNAFQKIPAQLLTPLVIVMLAHIQYLNIYKPQSVAVFWRIICPIFLQTPHMFHIKFVKECTTPHLYKFYGSSMAWLRQVFYSLARNH
jgi:hypothetical protein